MRGFDGRVTGARGQRGQTMAEYAVVLTLICASCLAAFTTFQSGVLAATIDRVSTLIAGM